LGEDACAGGVKRFLLLGVTKLIQRFPKQMLSRPNMSIWVALVHVCEMFFHFLSGEERHIFDA
jgi:hypothetical protein